MGPLSERNIIILVPRLRFQFIGSLLTFYISMFISTLPVSRWPSVREIQNKNKNETICALEESDFRGLTNCVCDIRNKLNVWYTTSEMCDTAYILRSSTGNTVSITIVLIAFAIPFCVVTIFQYIVTLEYFTGQSCKRWVKKARVLIVQTKIIINNCKLQFTIHLICFLVSPLFSCSNKEHRWIKQTILFSSYGEHNPE